MVYLFYKITVIFYRKMNYISKNLKHLLTVVIFGLVLISCGSQKEIVDTTATSIVNDAYNGKTYNFEEVDVIPHPFKTSDKLSKSEMELELRKFYMRGVFKHFTYPRESFQKNIQGRVLLKFVIDEKGDITGISVVSGVSIDINDAAIKIIKSLDRVSPAIKDGKAVAVDYALPITYKISRR